MTLDPGNLAQGVLDSLLEGCQIIGRDWTYLYVNSTVARQGGRPKEQLVGRKMSDCYPGIENTPMFAQLRRCLSARNHHRMENEFTFPDGSAGWFELQFVPVPEGVCILSVDITERKRAELALARSEDQLRHAQKMEAVGRLAGGVAHDFNNLLSVILSYAPMIAEALPPGDPIRKDVAEIEKAGMRARELTSQLLAFSRHRPVQATIINLSESIAAMDKVLQRVLGEDIELTTITPPSLGCVNHDAGQIEQIVLNLVVNARDAMPGGGKLTIETANVELDQQYADEHLGTEPGPHVMLAVSDTGLGMDKVTQARIFEPFFTTKEVGKGTGLGLSTVFGIVQQSRGSIWVYSEPGNGTTFKIYFPRAGSTREDVESKPNVETRRRGSETILVVEDDASLRRLVSCLLHREGYEVIVAAAPGAALDVAEEYSGKIDLLLTDVVMPEMNGRQLVDRFRLIRPETRVLYMSGYTDDVVVNHGVLDRDVAFLQKPITPTSLSRALREVLDTPSLV